MVKINITEIKKEKSINELLEFGIINIDKPSNTTSFDVSNFIKKSLNLRKTSHFGTLDPMTTGVLPIALNRACKLTGYFMKNDKEYVGIMRIHQKISMKKIQKIIDKKFTGKIKQLPPVKSRVKRVIREREIKKFKLLEQDDQNILFYVLVEKGTYIRKLIHDLAEEMKIGAHMLELRRTKSGIFKEHDKQYPSINLYDFKKAVEKFKQNNPEELKKMIIPGEVISKIYPVVKVNKKYIKKLLYGSPLLKKYLNKSTILPKKKIICVFYKNQFIGMYEIINQKDILAKPEFVMQ